MDAEIELTKWCKKNDIIAEYVSQEIWDSAIQLIEESMDTCLEESKNWILQDGSFMIEQELSEHPDWKIPNSTPEK